MVWSWKWNSGSTNHRAKKFCFSNNCTQEWRIGGWERRVGRKTLQLGEIHFSVGGSKRTIWTSGFTSYRFSHHPTFSKKFLSWIIQKTPIYPSLLPIIVTIRLHLLYSSLWTHFFSSTIWEWAAGIILLQPQNTSVNFLRTRTFS